MSKEVQTEAAVEQQVVDVVDVAVEQQVTNEQVANEQVDIFAQFMSEDAPASKDRDEVIKELIASGNCKRINGLTVRNVVSKEFDTHALLTFVVKEYVIGDVRSAEEDAFGQPIISLGKTHNIQTSSYAIAGVMKDSPKMAIFASDVVSNPNIANMLFAGAKIDVIMQFVAAGEEYTNPFASNAEPATFERDKMIHHVVRLELGEVGHDMYREALRR